MPPREPPGGSGVSLQSLCLDVLKSCMWPFLSSEDKKNFRLLSREKQTLVELSLFACPLDGPAFLTLADCHNLTTLEIECSAITSDEVTGSISCLTQLRSLVISDCKSEVDMPLLSLLSMPGLTELKVVEHYYPMQVCWGSPLMSVDEMRPAALRCLTLGEEVHPPGDGAAVLRLLPHLQDLTLGFDWTLQDSDAEALAGLSALTQLGLSRALELTRPHRLPFLKALAFFQGEDTIHGVPLHQLDWLIGGSTSLREIVFDEHYNTMNINISAMHCNVHDVSTALRSVSLALQQCRVRELCLDNMGNLGAPPAATSDSNIATFFYCIVSLA
eukprot:gene19185-25799_t